MSKMSLASNNEFAQVLFSILFTTYYSQNYSSIIDASLAISIIDLQLALHAYQRFALHPHVGCSNH